ncbi:MAG: hypothetical protein OEV93_03540 [Candidatus Moranbacteria bacterium]|nr:hypothetical protein [Candidatus Moranbacteria bacterium]
MANIKINKKGFSIGEVMLAVFIVGSTLVVVTGVMSRSLLIFFNDRDSVIASNLSQEGIELVRNIRDNDFVVGNDFGDGLGSTPGPENYIIERGGQLVSANNNEYLDFNETEGYNHTSGGSETEFSRKIIIEGENDEREVTSMVIWRRGNNFPTPDSCTFSEKCVMTKSVLTDWKKL